MTAAAVSHASFTLERVYDAAPPRVFAAWADPAARLRWGPPSADTVIDYLETDFRPGGRDLSRCGPRGKPVFEVEARYADIVPDARILFSEAVRQGECLLSLALVTVELRSGTGAGDRITTRLSLTNQITAFDPGMIDGNRGGWSAALANLATELAGAITPV